jgi:hypothetical protein
MSTRTAPTPDPIPETPPDDLSEFARSVRNELEEQHEARLRQLANQRERARSHRNSLEEAARNTALNKVREQVRESFYKEKGYQRYVDSTGRESWIPAEEFEHRMKRRGRKRRINLWDGSGEARWKSFALYGGLFLVAAIMGALIAR